MAFIEEIKSCFGNGEWSVYMTYPKGVIVSGYKKILELSNNKIVLSLPQKKKLILCGESLSISTLAESELSLKGIFLSLEVV